MLQILTYILFFVVFILLLVAVSFYLIESIGKYVREGREQRAALRGIPVQVNYRALQLFGHGELIGQLVDMLLPDHLRTIHQQHRTKYMASPRVRQMGVGLSLFALHANGAVIPVEVSLSPLTVGGERHVLAIIREKQEQ